MIEPVAFAAGYGLVILGVGILIGLGLARLGLEPDVLDMKRERDQ